MSIGWEEDSGFLQSGMEPRGGTMGPGTAPHSHQSPPRAGGSRPSVAFPEPFASSSGRTAARPAGYQRHLPSRLFLGFSGLTRDDCSHWGRAGQPTDCSSSASRVEPAFQPVERPGVCEGAAPFPPIARSAFPLPCTRAVPGPRGYPGVMGVSVSLSHSLPCTLAPRL